MVEIVLDEQAFDLDFVEIVQLGYLGLVVGGHYLVNSLGDLVGEVELPSHLLRLDEDLSRQLAQNFYILLAHEFQLDQLAVPGCEYLYLLVIDQVQFILQFLHLTAVPMDQDDVWGQDLLYIVSRVQEVCMSAE